MTARGRTSTRRCGEGGGGRICFVEGGGRFPGLVGPPGLSSSRQPTRPGGEPVPHAAPSFRRPACLGLLPHSQTNSPSCRRLPPPRRKDDEEFEAERAALANVKRDPVYNADVSVGRGGM